MKIFYESLGGYHTVTGVFIPCSVSMEIRNDAGVKLSRGDLFLPIIWGGPSLIYTTFSTTHGTADYFDWESQVNEFVSKVVTEAIEHPESDDSSVTVISWVDAEWVPSMLRGFDIHLVAYEYKELITPLSDVAKKIGFVMNSIDTDGRLDFTVHQYYNFQGRIG